MSLVARLVALLFAIGLILLALGLAKVVAFGIYAGTIILVIAAIVALLTRTDI